MSSDSSTNSAGSRDTRALVAEAHTAARARAPRPRLGLRFSTMASRAAGHRATAPGPHFIPGCRGALSVPMIRRVATAIPSAHSSAATAPSIAAVSSNNGPVLASSASYGIGYPSGTGASSAGGPRSTGHNTYPALAFEVDKMLRAKFKIKTPTTDTRCPTLYAGAVAGQELRRKYWQAHDINCAYPMFTAAIWKQMEACDREIIQQTMKGQTRRL
ncbi:hypothetical protein MMC14_001290 [Varicellaria rhodocarpa]|nr:hypothetical protein [Varicellaria rhodocarpa]